MKKIIFSFACLALTAVAFCQQKKVYTSDFHNPKDFTSDGHALIDSKDASVTINTKRSSTTELVLSGYMETTDSAGNYIVFLFFSYPGKKVYTKVDLAVEYNQPATTEWVADVPDDTNSVTGDHLVETTPYKSHQQYGKITNASGVVAKIKSKEQLNIIVRGAVIQANIGAGRR